MLSAFSNNFFLGPSVFLFVGIIVLVLLYVCKSGRIKENSLIMPFATSLSLCASLGAFFYQGVCLPTHYFSVLLLISAACIVFLTFFFEELLFLCNFEYLALFFLSLLGSLFALHAKNLLELFIGIELQTLPVYLMLALRKKHTRAFEASIKYFVLGGTSTGLILFGLSFIFGSQGHLNFPLHEAGTVLFANKHVAEPLFFRLGCLFLLGGMAFKMSLAPFHAWTPDVYEGSETGTTLFLGVCVKIAVVGLMWKLVSKIFVLDTLVMQALQYVALLSMLWGGLGALKQKSLKRLFAYSTIGHMGYIASVLSLKGEAAFDVTFFYMAGYTLTVLVFFTCLMVFEKGSYAGNTLLDLKTSQGPFGLKLTSWTSVSLFSLAALPPAPLFFCKLCLLFVVVESEAWLLVGGFLVNSLLGGYFYLKPIQDILHRALRPPIYDRS